MSFWSPPVAIPVVQDFTPVSSGVYSIGSTALRWKDGWFSGTLTVATLNATTLTVTTFNTTTVTAVDLTTTGNTVLGNAQTDTLNVGNGDIVKTSGGNTGFGTASPGVKVEISSNGELLRLRSSSARGSGNNALTFHDPSGVKGYLGYASGGNDHYFFANDLGDIRFLIANNTNLTLDFSGRKVAVGGNFGRGAPLTKTADWTVQDTENWFISNRAATNTVTLPAAASYTGREIMIKTIQAQTVVSASSNVVPLVGGAAGTAILAATAGRWATLVSDGINWVIMQGN